MRSIKQKPLLITTFIYLIITIFLYIYNVRLYANIINPLFYILIIIYIGSILKNTYVRFKENKYYNFQMFIITLIYLIVFFYIGFIIGFAKSPYAHTLKGFIRNFVQLVLPIIGIELIRGTIVCSNRKNKLIIIITTILLILLEINYSLLFSNCHDAEAFFKFSCSSILPLIFGNITYTYLCFKTSYKLPLIYRLMDKVTLLLLPIYPAVNWFVTGSFGILVPTIILFLYKYFYFKDEEKRNKKSSKSGIILTFAVAIFLVSFMLGVFKYEPIAIVSNSMQPSFSRGDVLVYVKLSGDDLKSIKNNSIIVYSIDNQNIAHRVVEVIQNDNGSVSYRTKGDNNNSPDSQLVETNQIKGVYVLHIKYVGFPSVWLHDFFNHEQAVVETE